MLNQRTRHNEMRRSMRGFSLVSTMVGLVMFSVVGYVTIKEGNRYLLERKAEPLYNGYHGLDTALDKYLKRNWQAMMSNQPVTGVVTVWAPTIAELQKQGYLDAFVQTKFNDVGQLSYTFTVLPAGCNLAAAQCNIAYIIQPTGGVKDEALANSILRRLGASGMINDVNNVNLARAWDGRRTMVSPVPVKNALFVTRVYPSSQLAAALPLDGSRPMTGDWDLGTKKLTGVGTFSTDTFKFSTTVNEGDPCTNTPGYKSLAMGSNHYIQICKDDGTGTTRWIHANEEVTVVVNTVIHTPPAGGWGASGGSGGTPGYLGADGRLYSDPNQENYCSSCNRPDGTTIQLDQQRAANSESGGDVGGTGNGDTRTGDGDVGGGGSSAPPGTGHGSPRAGPGSGDGGGE